MGGMRQAGARLLGAEMRGGDARIVCGDAEMRVGDLCIGHAAQGCGNGPRGCEAETCTSEMRRGDVGANRGAANWRLADLRMRDAMRGRPNGLRRCETRRCGAAAIERFAEMRKMAYPDLRIGDAETTNAEMPDHAFGARQLDNHKIIMDDLANLMGHQASRTVRVPHRLGVIFKMEQ
ncbi:MAG: hypothetical protein SGPRY_000987 [Prymnesium sp.]